VLFRSDRLMFLVALSAGSGLLELLQNFVPGRSPNFWDAVASTAGWAAGAIVGAAAIRIYDHSSKSSPETI
jgi:VanZ family protein